MKTIIWLSSLVIAYAINAEYINTIEHGAVLVLVICGILDSYKPVKEWLNKK